MFIAIMHCNILRAMEVDAQYHPSHLPCAVAFQAPAMESSSTIPQSYNPMLNSRSLHPYPMLAPCNAT